MKNNIELIVIGKTAANKISTCCGITVEFHSFSFDLRGFSIYMSNHRKRALHISSYFCFIECDQVNETELIR